MKFHLTFFSSLLIGLLLLSGQAFAVAYYSKPVGPWLWSTPSTWSSSLCGVVPVTTGPTAAPLATDDLIICNGSAVRVNAVSVGASATVNSGGTLDLSSNVLTLSGALTNDGGTILSGVQAFVAQSIIHNSGTTNLTGVTTNTTNSITVNGPGLALAPTLIGINGLFISNTTLFSMPPTVLSLTGNVVVTSGTLTLTSANAVTGNVTINDGAFVTGLTGGIIPTQLPAATPLPIPPLVCGIGYFLTISSTTHTYICVLLPPPNTVSAPLFSIKEKARVFTEEII